MQAISDRLDEPEEVQSEEVMSIKIEPSLGETESALIVLLKQSTSVRILTRHCYLQKVETVFKF